MLFVLVFSTDQLMETTELPMRSDLTMLSRAAATAASFAYMPLTCLVLARTRVLPGLKPKVRPTAALATPVPCWSLDDSLP